MTGASYDFGGRVVLVTGASGGIGRAVARAFAGAGASVMLCDVDEDAGLGVAAELASAPGEAHFHRTDLTRQADVDALFDALTSRFGRLDHAVNAAAIERESAPITECPVELFDQIIRVNLGGLFASLQAELALMVAQGEGGTIVNIGSTSSTRPQRHQPAYVASKHAVLGLTRSAALDYGEHGIRVNAICPGAIDTPMLEAAMARRGANPDALAAGHGVLGRIGQPDEVAAAALWLSSDASSFATGHPLAVDGGRFSV